MIRRRWLWIVIELVFGLILALAYLHAVTPTYESTAKVLVNSVSTDTTAVNSRTPAESVNLDTEAQLVASLPVATRAAKTLGTSGAVPLTSHVTVTVPPNSTVLDITFVSSSAKGAQAGAQAFAQAYLANRNATAQAAVTKEVTRAQGVVQQLGQQLALVNQQLHSKTPPSADAKTALLTQRDNLTTQLGAAGVTLSTLRGTAVNGGSIIFAAQLPQTKTSPKPLLVIPSGLIAGLMLGLLLAAFRERTDKRLHTSTDVQQASGVAVVGQANARRGTNTAASDSVQHETRTLYHRVIAAHYPKSAAVVVVGPNPSTANSVAEVLARVSANAGSRTTLIRRDGNSNPVSAPALTPTADLHEVDYGALGIVVDGELQSRVVNEAINRLRQRSDLIVLELPTGDPMIDLPALGHCVDVGVVVAQLGQSTRAQIQDLVGNVRRTSAREVVAMTVRETRRLR